MRMNQTVAQLNSYLHGEISAVETYRRVLEAISQPDARTALEQCEHSHEQRIDMLRKRIAAMGGKPAESSPPWTLSAYEGPELVKELEQFERQEISDYQREMVALDADNKRFLESTILPEAQKTRTRIEQVARTLYH